MKWVFVGLVAIHAVIHLMGPAKAFGLAELPRLTLPVSRTAGVAWLAAFALMGAALVALFVWPRWWWAIGAASLVLSQTLVIGAWADAKVGTAANAILLAGVVVGFLTQGPTSLRAEYEREVAAGLARSRALPPAHVIDEEDLAMLPAPVARYLRVTGHVGQPVAQSYRLRARGRIRASADEPWLDFEVVQQSFTSPPARLFLMDATMFGVPVTAFHRYVGPSATMRVKLAGAVTVADERGLHMNQAELVTLFNDMCFLAPSTLLSPHIDWKPVDDRTVRARFTNDARSIFVFATLLFDDEGRLVDFVSDDRFRGRTHQRWSTPLHGYRQFGPARLAARGEARWHAPPPEGEFAYIEMELLEVVAE